MSKELTIKGSEWDTVQRQARAFLASGYLREEFVKGVEPRVAIAKVATIITMGDELGIGRMQALRSINVIKGKPALAAELMLALCFKKIPGFKATFTTPVDKQHLECTLVLQRPGGDPNEFKFTIEDAKKAGLEFISKNGLPTSWTKYPRAMLRARVISEGLRAVAPDATLGMMTMEELGHEVVEHDPITPPDTTAPEPEQRTVYVPRTQLEKSPEPNSQPTGNTVGYDRRHQEKMSEQCTEPQRKKLYAMTHSLGWDDAQAKDWLMTNFNVESSFDLTKSNIQDAFEMLEGMKRLNDAV